VGVVEGTAPRRFVSARKTTALVVARADEGEGLTGGGTVNKQPHSEQMYSNGILVGTVPTEF